MDIAVIPLVSSIVSLVFAATVLDQFFAKRKPYQLIWSIGLFMFLISAGRLLWNSALAGQAGNFLPSRYDNLHKEG